MGILAVPVLMDASNISGDLFRHDFGHSLERDPEAGFPDAIGDHAAQHREAFLQSGFVPVLEHHGLPRASVRKHRVARERYIFPWGDLKRKHVLPGV
jgi:hypothetical protein